MKQRVVLFLILPYLHAADHSLIEMKEYKEYTQEQWKIFCAMHTAADLFFEVIKKENQNYAYEGDVDFQQTIDELEHDSKKYDQELKRCQRIDKKCTQVIVNGRTPSIYQVDDRRDSGLLFPERDFYLQEGLLFDPKKFSFICSLGTWQFADNGSFIHKCFRHYCMSCTCDNKKACSHVCRYGGYARVNPWQEVFNKMMKVEPYNQVENLLRVVKIKDIKIPAQQVIWSLKQKEVSPSLIHGLQEHSYEEQKKSWELGIADSRVVREYSFDNLEPDVFDALFSSRSRSLSIIRSIESIMPRRFSLPEFGQPQGKEVISDSDQIAPQQAQIIWAAMLAVKKTIDQEV